MSSKTDNNPAKNRQTGEETTSGGVSFAPSKPPCPVSCDGRANLTDDTQRSAASGEISEPRANALKHGLSATTLLSRVVHIERVNQLVAKLRDEYRPRSITEELLIQEIARHAAALDITEAAEPAVMRQSMSALELLMTADAAKSEDQRLTAAVTAETLDRCARYRRGHEKALHQALDKLRLVRAETSTPSQDANGGSDPFATSEACERYLRRHLLASNWRCPGCRSEKGHWLPRRKVWECASCAKQTGLRYGTVFEHSPLPLTTWFAAIRMYAAQTDIRADVLAERIGIKRLATVRLMLVRIRRAVADQDLERGLAGLLSHRRDG